MTRASRPSSDAPETRGLVQSVQLGMGRAAQAVAARLRRPVSLGVRLVALNPAGEVLLVRHSYLPGLALPGGGVDPGESCAEAALREAREEAGLTGCDPPRLFHVYFNRALAARDHVVLYVAHNATAAPRRASAEILSAGFYPVRPLPDATTRATRARLAEVLEDAPPADIW